MKTCTKCNEIKDESEFYGEQSRSDGLRPHCKACVSNQNTLYYTANKDKLCEYQREYRETNADAITVSQREYRVQNRFEIALRASAKEAKLHDHAPCVATVEEIKAAFTGKCHACGTTEEEHIEVTGRRLHLDHDHEPPGNFRGWLCTRCNFANVLTTT